MIYLSGKIDSGGILQKPWNIFLGWWYTRKLMKQGRVVYTPHLYVFVGVPYEKYMDLNFEAIDNCAEVWFMPNWRKSSGAKREHNYAIAKGKIIKYL